MQKHSDRLDKRGPILAPGTQNAGSGLMADPYSWNKVDAMSAMYTNYTGGSSAGSLLAGASTPTSLLAEADPRDVTGGGYTPPWTDVARSTSSVPGFSLLTGGSSGQSSASNDTKTLDLDSQFSRHNGGQVTFLFF